MAEKTSPGAKQIADIVAGISMSGGCVSSKSCFITHTGVSCRVRLKPPVFDHTAFVRFYDGPPIAGVRVANGVWFDDGPRMFGLGLGLSPQAEPEVARESRSEAPQLTVPDPTHGSFRQHTTNAMTLRTP
jgi:hypothetical protein